MRKLLHISLACFLSAPCFNSAMGQNTVNIDGFVTDSISREGIEFANILLLNTDSTFFAGATTDSTGYFHFQANKQDSYILKVSSIGYKGICCLIQTKTPHIRIRLKQNEIALDEIKVIGKFNRIKNNPSNMIFRLTDSMREYASLATDILEQIPTIYVDFNNNVFVKGSGNVLILRNGVELSNKTLVNQISPQSIERVEISRIIPTKYLAKGYSSIINIITKRSENTSLKVHGNLSPNRLYDTDFNFSMDKQKHSLYTFYKLYYRNFTEDQYINDSINNGSSNYQLRVKPRKEFDNEFFYGYSYNPSENIVIGFDGYLSLYRENFSTKHVSGDECVDLSDSKTWFNTQNYAAYLQYKDTIRTFKARVNLSDKRIHERINYFRPLEDNSKENNYRLISEVDYSRILLRSLKMNAGGNYSFANNRNVFFYSGEENKYKYSENSITAYIDFNIDTENFSFLLGANFFTQNKRFRDEDIDVKSTYIFPKLSAIYTLNSSNSLLLDFYSTQNQPTLWQLIEIPINITPNYSVKGNPYLKPENIMNASLEYNYSKGSTYFSTSVFYEYVKNRIVDEYTEINNEHLLSAKRNLNSSIRYGFFLLFNHNLFDWWTIRLGSDIINRFMPGNTYYKRNHASVNASITNAFVYKKIMLAVKYGYNGKQLAHNGYFKPYNSSLAQFRYRINPKLAFSLIWTQPIGNFKSKSMIYYNSTESYANHVNQIRIRSILFSFTYNIFNKSKQKNNIYYNEDKKY